MKNADRVGRSRPAFVQAAALRGGVNHTAGLHKVLIKQLWSRRGQTIYYTTLARKLSSTQSDDRLVRHIRSTR